MHESLGKPDDSSENIKKMKKTKCGRIRIYKKRIHNYSR